MALFSKHNANEKDKAPAPPSPTDKKDALAPPPSSEPDKSAPPAPNSAPPAPGVAPPPAPGAPAPAAPGAAPPPMAPTSPGAAPPPLDMGSAPKPASEPNKLEVPEVPDDANLSPPPLPGGTLEDIKKQVQGVDEKEPEHDEEPHEEKEESLDSNDEELFGMFDMEFPDGEETSSSQETRESVPKESVESEVSSTFDKLESSRKTQESNPRSFDNPMHIEIEDSNTAPEATTFLTTNQFKSLLEVVDSVKAKVRESSETHLRMMDMKSEESIEYESLRKNFQFIEDKLYDLDSMLFDK